MDKKSKREILAKITQKKEFSRLPEKDVRLAFEKFDKPRNAEYQKVKLTRNFLREVFSSFSSRKLLGVKKSKPVEWYLMKHKSTKERLPHYKEVYGRVFSKTKKCSIIDLGSGVNGLSYGFLRDVFEKPPRYIAVEAVGQLVDLTNDFFAENKINGRSFHMSLFEKTKVLDLVKKQPKPRAVFLMKVVDSLESVKRDYSKELIKDLSKISDLVVVSFATRSLGKRQKFSANRNWIVKFLKENFEIAEDFELGGERYLVLKPKKSL